MSGNHAAFGRLVLAVVATSSSGCFTGWVTTQAVGGAKVLDEGVREETVPLDGVAERLAVSLPLAIEYDIDPTDKSNPNTISGRNTKRRPFALTCSTKQYARDRVYHSAFRYGSSWKKRAGISFLVEAALGATFLLLDRNRDQSDPMKANDRTGLLVGGFFALDAIGTAAIFFIPRKEVFTVEDKAVMTPIRDDCPEGLALEIAGDAYPVDALGAIGDIGEAALDEWMRDGDVDGSVAAGAPGTSTSGSRGALALTFEGRAMPLRVEAREKCAWVRARDTAGSTGAASIATGTTGPTGTIGSDPSASGAPSTPNDPYSANGASGRPSDACRLAGASMVDLPCVTTVVITVATGTLSMAVQPSASIDAR